MNKSKFKFIGFSFLFALLFLSSVNMNAQTDAAITEFTTHPEGTFETEATFAILNAEMDAMPKGQVTIEYRYYWLVAVDIKRNNVAVEQALLSNLSQVSDEFNVTGTSLEALYQDTVDKL